MLSDSEKQLLSAIKQFSLYANNSLQLSHLYVKMDQPIKALEILNKSLGENPGEVYYIIYQARIQEMLNGFENSIVLYKNVLNLELWSPAFTNPTIQRLMPVSFRLSNPGSFHM
jgi:tetratricopeptide (TPR) repeat protein